MGWDCRRGSSEVRRAGTKSTRGVKGLLGGARECAVEARVPEDREGGKKTYAGAKETLEESVGL